MFKRGLTLLLALCLTAVLFAACQGAPGSSSSSQSASSAAQSQATGSSSGEEEPKPMYPVVTDGSVTLDYWLPIHVNATKFIASYAENEAYQEIEKNTGIKINYIHPASGQEQEQFNLLMVSNDMPDMVQGASVYYNGGTSKAVQDGVFLDLTDYLEEYAPDYYAVITADADIKREFFDENGRVAAFHKVVSQTNVPWMRPIARQDWLDEFGMEVPVTLDEYEAYFQAILDNKPGVVPFALPRHGTGGAVAQVEIFYGAFNLLPGWFVSEDTVRFGNADAVLREYLTLMNDWYAKGYISKDFPAMDDKQIWAEFDTGRLGMYLDANSASYTRTKGILEINSCPYPRKEKDSKLHCQLDSWKRSNGAQDVASVSASSDLKEYALQYLNYGYTDEGCMIYNYGVEGVTYTMENGKPTYTDYVLNHPNYTPVNCNYILRIHFGPKLGLDDLVANPNIVKSPEDLEFRVRWGDDPNCDNAYRIPPIDLTAEENTRRAEIMANVNTYSDEMILKFIIGTEPLANFDQYISRLKDYGIDEAIAITQAAYDRYMSKA